MKKGREGSGALVLGGGHSLDVTLTGRISQGAHKEPGKRFHKTDAAGAQETFRQCAGHVRQAAAGMECHGNADHNTAHDHKKQRGVGVDNGTKAAAGQQNRQNQADQQSCRMIHPCDLLQHCRRDRKLGRQGCDICADMHCRRNILCRRAVALSQVFRDRAAFQTVEFPCQKQAHKNECRCSGQVPPHTAETHQIAISDGCHQAASAKVCGGQGETCL